MSQPADVQAGWAKARLDKSGAGGFSYRARVATDEWPDGERWCSGCQSFVPLFYTTGSRCKSCASVAAHGARVEKLYGISPDEYNELFRFQRGRCYICQRQPRTKRLAVDHDHKSGQVRGLLCANNENGCNRAVVANLEAAVDGGLQAAKRAVLYFEHPPYLRMKGEPPPVQARSAQQPTTGAVPQPPPF